MAVIFCNMVIAALIGFIDDNSVTSWIDENSVTSWIDDNGVTG